MAKQFVDPQPARADTVGKIPGAKIPGVLWLTLLAVSLGAMMEALDGTVVVVANPVIALDLETTLPQLQWVSNGYMLAVAVFLIPAGRIGDRFGHKRLFLIGMTGFAISSVLAGFSSSIEMLIFWRVVQGLCGAVLAPGSLAVLRTTFPPDRFKLAVGIWGGVGAMALAIGPFVGGVIVDVSSWRWVFFINLFVCGFAAILGAVVIPAGRPEGAERPLDIPGMLLLSATLFGVVWGIVQVPSHGWTGAYTLGSFGAAAVTLSAFLLRERRTRDPLLPPSLFRSRSFSVGTVVLMSVGFAAFSSSFYLALYLQQVHEMSPLRAGAALLPLTALFGVGAPIGGLLNQRIGPRVPLVLGTVLIAGGLFGLSRLTADSSFNQVWPFLSVVGIGMGCTVPIAIEVIVSGAPRRYAGVASGMQQTALMLGAVLGNAAMGTLITARVVDVLPTRLADLGVGDDVTAQVTGLARVVAQGVAPTLPGLPGEVARAVTTASHAAYTEGLRLALLLGMAVVLAAALVAPLVRPAPHEDEGDDGDRAEAVEEATVHPSSP